MFSLTLKQSHSHQNSTLPSDFLTEIFLRLPLKPLFRFKSVSRLCYSLISGPLLKHRFSPNGILILQKNQQHDWLPLGLNQASPPSKLLDLINSGLKVLDSRHGMVICSSADHRKFYVLNPPLKDVEMVEGCPDFGALFATDIFFGATLVFDPSKSPHYEVVCLRHWLGYMYWTEIYSSESRSWRVNPRRIRPSVIPFSAVLCNGAIHWLSSSRRITFYYDVENRQFWEMPMPAVPDRTRKAGRKFPYFGESRGHLHLIENYSMETVRLNVYEMETDRSGWFVKYCVDLGGLTTEFPKLFRGNLKSRRFFYGFSVLYVVRALDEEESYIVVHVPGKIIRCRLKDGSVMCVDDFSPQGRLKYSWSNANLYLNCEAESEAEALLLPEERVKRQKIG